MSDWQVYSLHDKIIQILTSVPEYQPKHHFMRPYLSAYQIAIKIAHQFPNDFAQMGRPIGGSGSGERSPLAWYIADQLSKRIRQGEVTNIEGAFLHTDHMIDPAFNYNGQRIDPSTLPHLTLFRIAQ